MHRAQIVLFAALLAGCSSPDPTTQDGGVDAGEDAHTGCTTPFVGDAAKDPEVVITVLGNGTTATTVVDGDTVPLIFPPQGGRVIFAGARVTNVDPCGVQLTGAVRDLVTKQVRIDSRTVNLLPASDGWAETDPTDYASFSNVPVCPNQWSATDIYGTVYELSVDVVDKSQRTATKKVQVTPACAEPDRAAECTCICKGGYVLGEMCAADGGAGDGG